jgi:tRNA-2-methylthio-N6-dimethylallyladenosine synthase
MHDQVPEEVKRERIERLVERVQHHARRRNEALVGTLQEVLVEGTSRTDEGLGRGRSRGNKTVLFAPPAPEGALVQVRIASATSQTLRGSAQVAVPA